MILLYKQLSKAHFLEVTWGFVMKKLSDTLFEVPSKSCQRHIADKPSLSMFKSRSLKCRANKLKHTLCTFVHVHVSGRLSSTEKEVGEFVIGELKGVTPGHTDIARLWRRGKMLAQLHSGDISDQSARVCH